MRTTPRRISALIRTLAIIGATTAATGQAHAETGIFYVIGTCNSSDLLQVENSINTHRADFIAGRSNAAKPAMSIIVTRRGGACTVIGNFGHRDLDTDGNCTNGCLAPGPTSIYAIGSVSKTFTALLGTFSDYYLSYAYPGLFSLADTFLKYDSHDTDHRGANTTSVADFLFHYGGLAANPNSSDGTTGVSTRDRLYARAHLPNPPPADNTACYAAGDSCIAPGSWHYSGMGFDVVGQFMGDVWTSQLNHTGADVLPQFFPTLQEYVTDPLGITVHQTGGIDGNTQGTQYPTPSTNENNVKGYSFNTGSDFRDDFLLGPRPDILTVSANIPGGGLWMTPSAIATWMKFHLGQFDQVPGNAWLQGGVTHYLQDWTSPGGTYNLRYKPTNNGSWYVANADTGHVTTFSNFAATEFQGYAWAFNTNQILRVSGGTTTAIVTMWKAGDIQDFHSMLVMVPTRWPGSTGNQITSGYGAAVLYAGDNPATNSVTSAAKEIPFQIVADLTALPANP